MSSRVHPDVLSVIGSSFIRSLGITWRIEWRGLEHLQRAREISRQVVFSCWHGRLLVLSYTHRERGAQVLASEHPDGDLMGRTITRLGFGHLKGSTTRGGAKALRNLSAALRNGLDVGLTVDGPKGPRGVVQQGAIELGRLTGTSVVPLSNAARPRYLFDSWDMFQLPFPFARVVVAYGEPLFVASDADRDLRERYRLLLQERLNRLTGELDAELGYSGSKAWPHGDRETAP